MRNPAAPPVAAFRRDVFRRRGGAAGGASRLRPGEFPEQRPGRAVAGRGRRFPRGDSGDRPGLVRPGGLQPAVRSGGGGAPEPGAREGGGQARGGLFPRGHFRCRRLVHVAAGTVRADPSGRTSSRDREVRPAGAVVGEDVPPRLSPRGGAAFAGPLLPCTGGLRFRRRTSPAVPARGAGEILPRGGADLPPLPLREAGIGGG